MVDDLPKSNKDLMQKIAFSIEDASINVKACNLKEALQQVSDANDMARVLAKKNPTVVYFRQIQKCTSHVNSLLLVISGSQNAADQASRIAGMLDMIVMMLRG